MSRKFGQRAAGTLARRVESRLLASTRLPSQDSHWQACLHDAGVELERVVHVRPDSRGVFLTRHPEFGRCVLKTVSDTQHPHRAFTQLLLGQWLLEQEPTIFPEVLRSTSAYTLERYITGRPFRAWLAQDFSIAVAAEYFAGLRELTPPPGVHRWGEPLAPEELRAICRSYLRKCLAHSRYFGSRRQAAASIRLLRHSSALSERLRRIWAACATAEVPRALMCGDMGNVNILVQDSPRRMYNVDYEFLGPGHWGFDVAYFLSSLAKWPGDPTVLHLLEQTAFDGHVSPSAHGLFTDLTSVLSDVSRIVYRRDTRAAQSGRKRS